MNIYQISLTFIKSGVLFSLLASSLSSWAWNSMCHSPVQLSALMSRNKRQLGKEDRFKKQIRKLEKKIEIYGDKLDDVESDLADSLDKDKLQADPYSVAGSVRGYIENEQDGWPCANDSSATIRRSPHFLEMIFPLSYAEKGPPPPPPPSDKRTNCLSTPGNTWENNQCLTKKQKDEKECKEKKNFWIEGQCLTKKQKDEKECKEKKNFWIEGQCLTKKQKDEKECKEKKNFWIEGQCLTKKQKDEKECKEKKNFWIEGQCLTKKQKDEKECKEKKNFWIEGQCLTKKQKDEKECKEKKNFWIEGQCLTKKQKDEKECKEKKNFWIEGQCLTKKQKDEKECKEKKNFWIEGQCLTKKQKDEKECKEKKNFWIEGQCLTKKQKDEKECKEKKNFWIEGQCLTKKQKDEKECKEKKNWIGGKCLTKRKTACKLNKDLVWTNNNKCLTKEDDCKEQKKIWKNNKCLTKEDDCKQKPGKSWVGGACVDCPDWKKDNSFKNNGRVKSNFCDNYAADKKNCRRALSKLKKLSDLIQKYNKLMEELEDKILDLDDSEKPTTEAGGLCIDCLKRVMKASRPTANQNLGNIASLLTGVGTSMAGYHVGQSAQRNANMLRLQQGYPISNDYYALNGASAGFPFIANGLYGLTRVNTPVGGWSCSPSVNPYGQTYNYSYGHGYRMPYY